MNETRTGGRTAPCTSTPGRWEDEPVLQPYRDVLSRPGALAFSASGLLARLPMSMVGIGIVLLVEPFYGSYGLAGRIAGAYVLVHAVCAPQLSRLVDRVGQARVMRPAVAVSSATLAGLAWTAAVGGPVPVLYVLAALSGATAGSIGALVRARWSHLLDDGRTLHTAYSLESALDELVFVVGPVVVTLLATSVTPVAGLVVPVVALVAGGLAFLARTDSEPPPVRHAPGVRRRFVLRSPGMVVLALVFVATGGIFGATDVSVIAFAQEQGRPGAAGLMLAVFALGSLISGLGYGARQWSSPLWTRFVVGVVALGAGVSLFFVVDSLLALAPVMFVTGFAIAPTLITGNALVQQLVPRPQLTEGLTWVSTSLGLGVAVGASVGGVSIDRDGAHGGFGVVVLCAVAAVAVAVGAVLAARVRRRTVASLNG